MNVCNDRDGGEPYLLLTPYQSLVLCLHALVVGGQWYPGLLGTPYLEVSWAVVVLEALVDAMQNLSLLTFRP